MTLLFEVQLDAATPPTPLLEVIGPFGAQTELAGITVDPSGWVYLSVQHGARAGTYRVSRP